MSADIDPTHFGLDKIDALHDAGFWWDDEVDLWVNRAKRLAVSAFAVHECSVERLREFAANPVTGTWQIRFAMSPAPGLREAIIDDLERGSSELRR
jgi:hypothetical protein